MAEANLDTGGAGAGGAGGAGAGGGGSAGGGTGGASGAGAGGSGGGEKPFYESWGLDNTLTDFVTGKGFKTPAELAKSAALADKLVRERNVVNAPDPKNLSEWDGWEKVGWTKEIKDYKVADAKVPDGLKEYNKGMEAKFLEAAHANKIPAFQAGAMRDAMLNMMAAEVKAREAEGATRQAELTKALQTEWGADFKVKSDLATRAAKALGLDLDTAGKLEQFTGAPGLLKLFAKFGESMSEDQLKGGSARNSGGVTPEGAASELRRLEADPEFIKSLQDVRHPLHKDNSARRLQLIAAKVGQ